jgi:RNA recognition motif-containing protein
VAYSNINTVCAQLLKVDSEGVTLLKAVWPQAPQASNIIPYDPACHLTDTTRSESAYARTAFGLPVNVQQGAFLTEARGIFIQNLDYKCTAWDLTQLLLTVANPVDFKLIRDPRTGTFKGSAKAAFATEEDAEKAIKGLHGIQHMGRTLRARQDKEPTIVKRNNEPLIVSSGYFLEYEKKFA